MVVVHNGDIYYKGNPKDKKSTLRLTYTGQPGVIFNGIPDWLYEGKRKIKTFVMICPHTYEFCKKKSVNLFILKTSAKKLNKDKLKQ